jgi:hypothetical protein
MEAGGRPRRGSSRRSADYAEVDPDGETVIIFLMSRRYRRIWAILLALLLTLFPLEGALATPASDADALPMAGPGTPHAANIVAVGHATKTADACQHCTGDGCVMHLGCRCVHCAACVLAIASPFMLRQKITGADARPWAHGQGTAREVSSPLLRPPRG